MTGFQKRLLTASLAACAAWTAPALAQDVARAPAGPAETVPEAPPETTPASRAERLDALFVELAEPGRDDAPRIESDIKRLWSQSGSPAMDLLLRRSQEALAAGNTAAALDHVNAAIDHDPDFAEAWNLRAAIFFQMNEYALATNDIEHALALEPRHFDAMEGLAMIFQETDRPELALRALRAARAVNPNRESLKEAEERLERELGASSL